MNILNTQTLEKLFNWMSSTDRAILLQVLLHELPKDAQQLQLEIAQGDLQKIRNQAHRIKGAYSNLGCTALCDAMQIIEVTPETTQRDTQLRISIAALLQQTQDALKAYELALTKSSQT